MLPVPDKQVPGFQLGQILEQAERNILARKENMNNEPEDN
jgi:hypothetical protein